MIFFCFVVFFLDQVHGKEYSCGGADPLEVCGWNIGKEYIPFNEVQLVKFCVHAISYYSCVKEHSEEFPDEDGEYCGYPLVLRKSESLVTDLCVRGSPLYLEYLKHLECFHGIQAYFDDSMDVATKMSSLYFNVAKNAKYAQSLKTCITGTQFIKALGNRIHDVCGEDAEVFYQELVDRSELYFLYCFTDDEYDRSMDAVQDILHGILSGKIKNKDLHSDGAIVHQPPDGLLQAFIH